MSERYLVTGVAGTGKSTLKNIFSDKGYVAIDLDDGYAHWANRCTNEPTDIKGNDAKFFKEFDWMLRSEAFDRLLKRDTQMILFGTTCDLKYKTDLFRRVFLLEYPNESAVVERLGKRADGFGNTPEELASVLSFYEKEQEAFNRLGAHVLRCTRPLDDIAIEIEDAINNGQ